MATVVRIPGVPHLDRHAQPSRPFVVLLGAEGGKWQIRAVKVLDKQARTVARTDVLTIPRGPLHPSEQWMALRLYCEHADEIVVWVGNGDDCLYLHEWLWVSFAVAQWPQKLILGMERDPEHPMAPTLGVLLSDQGIGMWHELDDILAVASERCREIRSSAHG